VGLLNTSLQIGKSAIMAHSLAMDVVGNNIANAGTDGYARRAVDLHSIRGIKTPQGPYLGLGVNADSIRRLADVYLEQRLRDARSTASSFTSQDEALSRLEGVFNELGDNDLSTAINDFFTALSTLQGNPEERSIRRSVVETAITFTESVRSMRDRIDTLRKDINSELGAAVDTVNSITAELATLNIEISRLEAGGAATGGSANSLRDRRDALLGELADLVEVRVIDLDNGSINVFAGSDPLVMGNRSYDVTTQTRIDRGVVVSDIVFAADGRPLELDGGKIEGLVTARNEILPEFVDDLDTWAGAFVEGFNRIHSSGQGLDIHQDITGVNSVADINAALNAAGLDFAPNTGTFDINVRNDASGDTVAFRLHVDLDGLDGNDTTLSSLVADINGALAASFPQVQASVGPGNTLRISSSVPGLGFSFSNDTSGALAALGVNTFFVGHDSSDIDVSRLVNDNPGYIAAALTDMPGDNSNVTKLVEFQQDPLGALGGASVEEYYQGIVSTLGIRAAAAQDRQQGALAIKASVEGQRETFSGVSLDEEAVKLIRYQSGYAAAARYISTVDELLDVLLSM